MILKQGKKAKIKKNASVNRLGKNNGINYYVLYHNDIKTDVFFSIADAIKEFNRLENEK